MNAENRVIQKSFYVSIPGRVVGVNITATTTSEAIRQFFSEPFLRNYAMGKLNNISKLVLNVSLIKVERILLEEKQRVMNKNL